MFFERPFIIISFSSRHRVRKSFQIPTQRQVQARNGVTQTRIFDQMGHRQKNTSRQKRKTKLHSVPRGKDDDYVRSFKEYS